VKSAIVIGTGGHSRVVLALLAHLNIHVFGLVELGTLRKHEKILHLPVLGGVEVLDQFEGRDDINVYMAVGDNALRSNWFLSLKARQFSFPNLLSPHAIVDANAQLGEANIICPRAYIGPGAVLGDNNLINTAAIIEHEVRIGNHCHLASSAIVAGRSHIADLSMLGAGSIVIDSLRIAECTMVGAGAVVVRNIEEPGNTWLGVPATRAGSAS
jgi:sugar O-acyltransferase (sialic acid O-acetyltransferase NeuD family)